VRSRVSRSTAALLDIAAGIFSRRCDDEDTRNAIPFRTQAHTLAAIR
jgi:hypothetical protein